MVRVRINQSSGALGSRNRFVCAVVLAWFVVCVLTARDLSASFAPVKRPVIRAGVFEDSPPFHFMKNGTLSGFDVDLVRAAAKNVGYDVEFTIGDEDRIMNGLASGACDIVIDVVRNRTVEEKYALSIATSVITYGAFVKGDKIRTENDLHGARVAIREGVYMMDVFPRSSVTLVFSYPDNGVAAFTELAEGRVDAVLFPELQGRRLCRSMNLTSVRQLENFNIYEERCIAAAKSNVKLIRSLNTGISRMKERGEFLDLYLRWFFGKERPLEQRVFKWILLMSGLLLILSLVSMIFVRTLRGMVRIRTKELAASEEKYRILVKNIPQSIFMKDTGSRYLSCNQNFAADLGTDCGEVIGKNDYDFYPKDLAEKYRGDDARIMETGNAENLIERYVSRGQKRWIHTVKSPVRNEKGDIEGIFGLIWDITDYKLRDDELRESERRLSIAERVANVGSWELDVLTGVMVWSKQLFRIFGLEPGSMVPTVDNTLPVLHKDDRSGFLDSIRCAMVPGGALSHRVRIVRRDGSTVWIELRGEAVCDDSGQLVKFVGSAHDITDVKHSAERLQESLNEKESLIRELYHRTKNNMQVICSMLSFRSRELQDEPMKAVFTDMKNRIFSMALVHQKLYSSKNLSRINLREYVVELVGGVIRSYDMSHVRIAASFEMDDVFVNIDTAIPFGMALHEFVANTCKYAFEGKERGKISVRMKKDDDGMIEFTISDNGIGMDLVDGNPANSRMGLKTAYALICDQLHGSIVVESEDGLRYVIRFHDLEKKHKY